MQRGRVGSLLLALRHARLQRTHLGSYIVEEFCRLTGFAFELRSGVLEEDYLARRLR